jgi:hypothetical protein
MLTNGVLFVAFALAALPAIAGCQFMLAFGNRSAVRPNQQIPASCASCIGVPATHIDTTRHKTVAKTVT